MAAGNVLVVDDDPGMRRALLDFLSESGFHALGAATGEEALAALASLPLPCVVLLDPRLPGISGADVAAQLLASAQADQLHVIIISGSDLVAPPGAAFLRKPFEAEALLALIRDAFARSDLH